MPTPPRQLPIALVLALSVRSRPACGWEFGNGRFAWLNGCNEHGSYDFTTRSCVCEVGWGSPREVSLAKSPRCDVRICPAGHSLASLPSSTTAAHELRECSGAGQCDRETGECVCFDGFAGRACERCKVAGVLLQLFSILNFCCHRNVHN